MRRNVTFPWRSRCLRIAFACRPVAFSFPWVIHSGEMHRRDAAGTDFPDPDLEGTGAWMSLAGRRS